MRMYFSSGRGSNCLGVAAEHNLYEYIGDIDVCTEFEMLKVRVPMIFLGTVGFSPLREGRYRGDDILTELVVDNVCNGFWIMTIDKRKSDHCLRSDKEKLASIEVRHAEKWKRASCQ